MRIHVASPPDLPKGLDLPWTTPLVHWPEGLLVRAPKGLSRNVVRFASWNGALYALKEIPDRIAEREYRLLRQLHERNLPVVEPIGVVTQRGSLTRPMMGMLITRYLEFAMPYRIILTSGDKFPVDRERLLGALVDLLVRLHLAGFHWGDCSLSNTLFKRDAGRLAAYLVDAETGEQHPALSDGQRNYDLDLARDNIAGELMDVDAECGLPQGIDPIDTANDLVRRYERLWGELNRAMSFDADEIYKVEARINDLHRLGFDVEEIELHTDERSHRVSLKTRVVERGYHKNRLNALTGLEAQENQSVSLLHDIQRYGAWLESQGGRRWPEAVIAYRWFTEVYTPTIEAVPERLRGKLAGPEIYHQILEHRWYMSEREGRSVGTEEALASYIRDILPSMPSENLGPDLDTAAGAGDGKS